GGGRLRLPQDQVRLHRRQGARDRDGRASRQVTRARTATMPTQPSSPQATREAAQPSLWDRLVNDLPGVSSEIDGLREALAQDLGAERLDALVAAGPRGIEADA